VDLVNSARVVRRSVKLLLLTTLLGALVGAAIAFIDRSGNTVHSSQRYYSATETLGYDPTELGSSATGGSSSLTTVGAFVTGPAVTKAVGEKLHADGTELARQITTVARPTNNSVDVIAFATSAAGAEQLARQFSSATRTLYAQQLASQLQEQATQLSRRLDDLKARREAVEAQLANPDLSSVDRDVLNAQSDALVNQYRIAYDRFINVASPDTSAPPVFTLSAPSPISVDATTYRTALERGQSGENHLVASDTTSAELSPAPPTGSLPSGPITLTLLGALIGLAVGVGFVLIRAHYDAKLRLRTEFEEAFGIPVLGGIPELAPYEQELDMLAVIERPYSPAAEAYRSIRSALLLLGSDNPAREGALVVMIGSAQPKEGKSATCANLAAAFAEAGRTTLAINCDYRRPTLHRYFGLENEPEVAQITGVPGLTLVTDVEHSKSSPGRVAADQRAFIESQREHYDVIVLDTAPFLGTSDPIDIVSVVDFVVLVGRVQETERDQAAQTMRLLDRHRVNVAGLVLTAVTRNTGETYGYYYWVEPPEAPPDADQPGVLDPAPRPPAPPSR